MLLFTIVWECKQLNFDKGYLYIIVKGYRTIKNNFSWSHSKLERERYDSIQ